MVHKASFLFGTSFLFLLSLLSFGKICHCDWFHQDIKVFLKESLWEVERRKDTTDTEIVPVSGTDCQTTLGQGTLRLPRAVRDSGRMAG